MRKSLEEICEITPWCYYRNVDLVGVYYGDCPLRTYTEKDHEWHEEVSKTNKTLANLGAVDAITWSLYGDYEIYDIGIGAPTGKKDLIVMIAYYLADLVSIAIGYLAILLLTDRLTDSKEPRS